MTVEEIHSQLKSVSKEDLLKFKTDLESDSTQFIKTYNNPSNVLHVLGHAIIKALYNSRTNFPIPNWDSRRAYLFYDNGTSGIPRCDSIISLSLPIEIWPYLPKALKTRLQKAKQDQDRQASTKDIKLDLMSFMMFKSHLASQKKKMSSAFALDQLGKLLNLFSYRSDDPKQLEIAAKYISLIWEHTPVKSVNLCSYLVNKNYKIAYLPHQHLPFQIIDYDWGKDPLEATLKQAEFAPAGVIPFRVYKAVATKYNIPVHQELYTERESEHHIWIPGVDKPSTLKLHQLNMVLSQITVLDYIIVNLLGNSTCPYFHQLRDQLMAEILKPDYRDDVETYFNTTIKSYQSAIETHSSILAKLNSASKSIKELHESI